MRRSSESPATGTVTARLRASRSSTTLSGGLRKVRLSDSELLERVQRIPVPHRPVELRNLTRQHGWKKVRTGTSRVEMHVRALLAHTNTAPFTTRQCQVVAGGEMRGQVSELLALLRAPTESDSNAILHTLYGSRFIYSSLLHMVVNSSERGSSFSPQSRGSVVAADQQLTVRTASFVHTGIGNPFKRRSSSSTVSSNSIATSDSHASTNQLGHSGTKNEQLCYIELLTPTQRGFKLVFRSLDTPEVTAGKAPPELVVALHPISGWLTAEPTRDDPGTLQFTFQASFGGEVPGGCNFRVAQARLLFFGKGICRLEKMLRRRHTAPGRLWQAMLKPFRALGSSDDESSGGTHRNWRCIACTRSFLPTLKKSWRRCDLCTYRVCAQPSCCSEERVAIYNRYVVPLSVCARCLECIDERDSGNQTERTLGDTRYAGVSLHFAGGPPSVFEPDPEIPRRSRLGATHRTSEGTRGRRRTQSDPPPLLIQHYPNYDDDNNARGTDPNTDLRYC